MKVRRRKDVSVVCVLGPLGEPSVSSHALIVAARVCLYKVDGRGTKTNKTRGHETLHSRLSQWFLNNYRMYNQWVDISYAGIVLKQSLIVWWKQEKFNLYQNGVYSAANCRGEFGKAVVMGRRVEVNSSPAHPSYHTTVTLPRTASRVQMIFTCG